MCFPLIYIRGKYLCPLMLLLQLMPWDELSAAALIITFKPRVHNRFLVGSQPEPLEGQQTIFSSW